MLDGEHSLQLEDASEIRLRQLKAAAREKSLAAWLKVQEAAGTSRPTTGDYVRSIESSEDGGELSTKEIRKGKLGKVVEDDGSNLPFKVKFANGSRWCRAESVRKVPEPDDDDDDDDDEEEGGEVEKSEEEEGSESDDDGDDDDDAGAGATAPPVAGRVDPSFAQRAAIAAAIAKLVGEALSEVITIIQNSVPAISGRAREIEIDLDALDSATVWQLHDHLFPHAKPPERPAAAAAAIAASSSAPADAADVDGAVDGVPSLVRAAGRGDLDGVLRLLSEGAAVNEGRRRDGATALWVAAEAGHADVAVALISASADVDQPTTDRGVTPLRAAAAKGRVELVRALVAAGADVDSATWDEAFGGITPLFMAAQNGHPTVVRVLLEANADTSLGWQKEGRTPLGAARRLACLSGARGRAGVEIVDALEAAGAAAVEVGSRAAALAPHLGFVSILLAQVEEWQQNTTGRQIRAHAYAVKLVVALLRLHLRRRKPLDELREALAPVLQPATAVVALGRQLWKREVRLDPDDRKLLRRARALLEQLEGEEAPATAPVTAGGEAGGAAYAHAAQLEELVSMGFVDEAANRTVLDASGGELATAIEMLMPA